jgi:hypothetical protein
MTGPFTDDDVLLAVSVGPADTGLTASIRLTNDLSLQPPRVGSSAPP